MTLQHAKPIRKKLRELAGMENGMGSSLRLTLVVN